MQNDDDKPVTLRWLRQNGMRRPDWHTYTPMLYVEVGSWDIKLWWHIIDKEFWLGSRHKLPARTRGEYRLLREVLGIPIQARELQPT